MANQMIEFLDLASLIVVDHDAFSHRSAEPDDRAADIRFAMGRTACTCATSGLACTYMESGGVPYIRDGNDSISELLADLDTELAMLHPGASSPERTHLA